MTFMLVGCGSGGAVVFAPAPLPPDMTPRAYRHPGGAFELAVRPDWSVYVQNDAAVAAAAFSPPGALQAVLTAAAIHTGAVMDGTALADAANAYQTLHRPDLRRYTETAREQLPDGSWRFSGVRRESDGTQHPLNTFISADGAMLGVVEVDATEALPFRDELEISVNSLVLNPEAPLPPAPLSALSFVHTATLEVRNSAAWTNATGVLFVTGEVANYADTPLADLPVKVTLLGPDGQILQEAADIAMGYQVSVGGFAPFSLRFGQGQPVDAVRFRVTLGETPAFPPARPIVTAPTLRWTEESLFAPEGVLIVLGTLTNEGSTPIRDPLATVTVFDINGDVIGAWFTALGVDALAASESVNYEIRVPELGGGARSYILDIQALGS